MFSVSHKNFVNFESNDAHASNQDYLFYWSEIKSFFRLQIILKVNDAYGSVNLLPDGRYFGAKITISWGAANRPPTRLTILCKLYS